MILHSVHTGPSSLPALNLSKFSLFSVADISKCFFKEPDKVAYVSNSSLWEVEAGGWPTVDDPASRQQKTSVHIHSQHLICGFMFSVLVVGIKRVKEMAEEIKASFCKVDGPRTEFNSQSPCEGEGESQLPDASLSGFRHVLGNK